MKKFIHALVLAVFSFACWLSWVILGLSAHLQRAGQALPGFTSLCVSLRPVLIALPILTAIYCIWVWLRKSDRVPSWVGFFAATAGVLVLTALPALVAAYLPLLDAIDNLPRK